MTHKFDPKNMAKLDNPERRAILPPEETLFDLGLKENDIMADIGAGSGYFTIPASAIVGPGGRVYAIDTSDVMIEELNKKISANNISNITVLQSDEYDFPLKRGSVDFAFLSHVLHEVEDKTAFLKAAYDIMKTGGILAVVDWQKKESDMGPPVDHRVDVHEAADFAREAGFGDIAVKILNRYFYTLTGRK